MLFLFFFVCAPSSTIKNSLRLPYTKIFFSLKKKTCWTYPTQGFFLPAQRSFLSLPKFVFCQWYTTKKNFLSLTFPKHFFFLQTHSFLSLPYQKKPSWGYTSLPKGFFIRAQNACLLTYFLDDGVHQNKSDPILPYQKKNFLSLPYPKVFVFPPHKMPACLPIFWMVSTKLTKLLVAHRKERTLSCPPPHENFKKMHRRREKFREMKKVRKET